MVHNLLPRLAVDVAHVSFNCANQVEIVRKNGYEWQKHMPIVLPAPAHTAKAVSTPAQYRRMQNAGCGSGSSSISKSSIRRAGDDGKLDPICGGRSLKLVRKLIWSATEPSRSESGTDGRIALRED